MSASDPDEPIDDSAATVETEWLRFGITVAVAQLAFLVLVIGLLRIDLVLALPVALFVSIVGGIAITAYVLWWN